MPFACALPPPPPPLFPSSGIKRRLGRPTKHGHTNIPTLAPPPPPPFCRRFRFATGKKDKSPATWTTDAAVWCIRSL